MVDAMSRYDMAPANGMALRNPLMKQTMAQVLLQYPEYDATQFPAEQKALKDLTTGKQGDALRSFSVATDHLATLLPLIDALDNESFPLINKAANFFQTQIGGHGCNELRRCERCRVERSHENDRSRAKRRRRAAEAGQSHEQCQHAEAAPWASISSGLPSVLWTRQLA